MRENPYLKMSIPELVEARGSHAEPGSMRSQEIDAALQVAIAREADRRAARATRVSGAALAVSILAVVVPVIA